MQLRGAGRDVPRRVEIAEDLVDLSEGNPVAAVVSVGWAESQFADWEFGADRLRDLADGTVVVVAADVDHQLVHRLPVDA